jgi:hypothetical protein
MLASVSRQHRSRMRRLNSLAESSRGRSLTHGCPRVLVAQRGTVADVYMRGIDSPYSLSGMPKTAQSRTAGISYSTDSISAG